MPQTSPPQPLSRSSLLASHRILTGVIIALIGAAALGAVVWEVLRVTTPPTLTVTTPADNLLTSEAHVTLEGQAARESSVTVNGVPVAIGIDGSFKEELDLRSGLNIITISASKKFAKPRIIYRRVVVSKE